MFVLSWSHVFSRCQENWKNLQNYRGINGKQLDNRISQSSFLSQIAFRVFSFDKDDVAWAVSYKSLRRCDISVGNWEFRLNADDAVLYVVDTADCPTFSEALGPRAKQFVCVRNITIYRLLNSSFHWWCQWHISGAPWDAVPISGSQTVNKSLDSASNARSAIKSLIGIHSDR